MGFKTLLLSISLFFSPLSFAYNYPDIEWKTYTTKHFVIHYYEGVKWTASKVASVAEEVYPMVTGIYGHQPTRRTHIVVRDDEDTSNGFAVYNLGFITVWASPSDLRLRGRHDWIRGVVTHEFAHIVSLQTSSATGWLIEGLRFGGISNRDTDANTDVGGTALILTNPYARWWAEGTAEVDTSIAGYDLWDHNQEMLLRAATLENNLLSFDQMRNISVREHFGGEMVYNQGYAFLLWLREKYGKDANVKIARASQTSWNLDFDKNLLKGMGKTSKELYSEWKAYLTDKYQKQVAEIEKAPREGEKIQLLSKKALGEGDPKDRPYKDGVANAYPRISPDGRWFSWIHRGTLNLKYLDNPFILTPPPSEDEKELKNFDKPPSLTFELPGRSYSWASGSRKIVLSDRRPNVLNGYPYYDLFIADIGRLSDLRQDYLAKFRQAKTKKEKKRITKSYEWSLQSIHIEPSRLTQKQRATHPSWSPDGNWIVFSANRDGHRDLRLIDPEGKKTKDLVAIGGDSEAIDPQWSPDGKQIVFTLFHHDQSDIWIVNAQGGAPKPITLDAPDDREPFFTGDGKEIIFSSDHTGIFQLYRLKVNEEKPHTTQITNLATGAFMPFVGKGADELFYVRFSSYGFKLYRLGFEPWKGTTQVASATPAINEEKVKSQLKPETFPSLDNSKSYFPWPRPVRLFPTFIFENDQFKAGIAAQVSDFLEKHSLTASALFGEDQDYQFAYFNDMFYPTLFASYTAYIRNNDLVFVDDGDGIEDDARGLLHDNIQFVSAGISQDFHARRGLAGTHVLSLSYDRRFVDRRVGFPTLIDNTEETAFRLVTNDGVTMEWVYSKVPGLIPRDFDINPQEATFASASYSLVHTHLFSPDTTISAPNKNYYYHEGTLSLARYFAMPWEKPWWEHHTYWIRFIGGVKSRDVTSIDEFFLGGRINFRAFGQVSSNTLFYGYEDFSISGETMVLLTTGYTFPIARAIDQKKGFFYVDSIYGSIFGEVGNAWQFGQIKNLDQNATHDRTLGKGEVVLQDVGAEIRIKAFLFNDFNRWSSVFRVAYGFQDDARHGFTDTDLPVRLYVGIGTDF